MRIKPKTINKKKQKQKLHLHFYVHRFIMAFHATIHHFCIASVVNLFVTSKALYHYISDVGSMRNLCIKFIYWQTHADVDIHSMHGWHFMDVCTSSIKTQMPKLVQFPSILAIIHFFTCFCRNFFCFVHRHLTPSWTHTNKNVKNTSKVKFNISYIKFNCDFITEIETFEM